MALADIVEAIVELVDLANWWRFCLPTITGVIIAWFLLEWLQWSTPAMVIAGLVVVAGIFTGLRWQNSRSAG